MSEEHSDYGQNYTFSSGISVIILPFPSLRYEKMEKQSRKKFPLPKPPRKKIKVVDGTETIDDLKNEKYLSKKKIVENNQVQWFSEKILKICLRDCIELDLTEYENIIMALEEDNEEPYSENPLKRKVEFLTEYVIRSAGDFKALIEISTKLMQVDDIEVSEQLDSFPDNVEGTKDNGTETSSFDEVERLEVQSKS